MSEPTTSLLSFVIGLSTLCSLQQLTIITSLGVTSPDSDDTSFNTSNQQHSCSELTLNFYNNILLCCIDSLLVGRRVLNILLLQPIPKQKCADWTIIVEKYLHFWKHQGFNKPHIYLVPYTVWAQSTFNLGNHHIKIS